MSTLRDLEARKADVLAALYRQKDLWLDSADPSGRPHLIAVSAWWDGKDVVIATGGGSRTARNLKKDAAARLALGSPDDVIVIDAHVVGSSLVADSADLAGAFASAVGWNPREVGEDWVFIRLAPERIQAYKGYDELEGRDVMKNARWLA